MNSAQCSTVAILTMVKNLNCCNTRQTNEHQCMLLKTEYIPVLKYSKLHLILAFNEDKIWENHILCSELSSHLFPKVYRPSSCWARHFLSNAIGT